MGREDLIPVSFVSDMVDALTPYTDKAMTASEAEFQFLQSREIGIVWVLNELWNRLGMGKAISSLVEDRKYRNPIERMIFAMVAARIIAPGSKLSIEHWVETKVIVPV